MEQSLYLAHIAEDGREQTVLSHLQGTAALCAAFAKEFGAEKLGLLVGMAHDIGKYSHAFQRRLQGGPKVDHATAGAYECARAGQTAAAFCVVGHHGGLPDGGGRGDAPEAATFWGRMNRAAAHALPDYADWAREVTLPPASLPDYCANDPLSAAFFTRMLYSCLVDADFLDTEAFMDGKGRHQNEVDMALLTARLEQYIAPWFPPKGALNTRRCDLLRRCMAQGEVSPPGLFTLTVPTGGGKTVASLAFALKHAKAHGLRRVIYVIPYTSIIEQTAAVFRDILGEDHVLEHHSGVLYDTEEEATPETVRLRKATENWDMPVIVTTAVQFFESLYDCRPSRCRKLHNLANSVIIFDEAQMLPIPYLLPCVSAISQLVAHYGVSAVLCTATQPALEPLFAQYLPGQTAVELCPANLFSDNIFRRVVFQRVGQLSPEDLAQKIHACPQALCIVNSRKSAQTVFSLLNPEGAFHLSTLMTPAHRKAVLAEIRRRLTAGEDCRVVATSLIEAGVDVDFPVVFREEAGLDSILQAAGRCNREGNRPVDESIVTVFRFNETPPPLFDIPIAAGRIAMDAYADLSSREAVDSYFRELLSLKGAEAQDKQHILATLAQGDFPFRRVAERFRLIDSDTRTIYIPLEAGADLIDRLRKGECSRALFRTLGQYSVSVYDKHFEALEYAGVLEPLPDGSAILTDLSLYSPSTGLSLQADSGQALFI